MKVRIGDYQITPHQSGECWSIAVWKEAREWKGKSVEAGWSDLGTYPASLSHAINKVVGYTLQDDPKTYDGSEVAEAVREIGAMLRESINYEGERV